MQNGSHFPEPAQPAPRRLRRAAGVACGAIAVGAAAMLVVDVTGGGAHPHKLGLTSAAAGVASTLAPAPSPTAATGAPTTPAPSTAAPSTTVTTVARPPAVLPDGSPLPVLVVFDGGTITLAGSVPTEAAATQLRLLAKANSKDPAQVIDRLVVDPRVPASVGVRVIEMNATRFAPGSSQVSADYAPELARVIALMRAMPWVTTLVIGHADQTGITGLNLELSQARANAVIDYLVSQGISPDRLAGQGVGDRQPLTTQKTSVALALNRRTEFVFYGLLANSAR
ncbi:MAG TPA: OmpA family protein [Acidimicrobiales bacterium]|nr:OmpA family protein [Acidimicrobiales bacterium]